MICPTNVPRPKRPLHDFVPCFGRYANAARYRRAWSVASIPSTLDVARSIKPSHSLRGVRLLIVEILNAARWQGLFAMFDLSNFEQSWPWWWTKLDDRRSWEFSRCSKFPLMIQSQLL